MVRTFIVASSVVLLFVSTLSAQRHGSGNAGQQQGRPQTSVNQGSGIQQRDRVQARTSTNLQQRQQLRTCTSSTDRIRTQTREMSKQASRGSINAAQAQRWREQLQNQVQSMNQQHEQFMAGLSDQQKLQARDQIQALEQSRTRLQQSADALSSDLSSPDRDRDRIRDRARDTEQAALQLKQAQNAVSANFD